MQGVNILRESNIVRTPRLMQMEGLFDVAPLQRSAERWTVNLSLPAEWNVGLIVGPSGCGKTTIAKELFGQHLVSSWQWPQDKSILDGFPASMGIKEIVDLLSSVGFSSPPSWVRPFHVLSNGEQFRVNMARTLAESPDIAVVDEFTSVVDRTVAQIGSAAIQKTVRRRKQRFIAVSCHYDIAEWLEPDWIYEPATDKLTVGRSLRRPQINLVIKRVDKSAWQMFRKHHYLDTNLNTASRCFVAFWKNTPVAFTSILNHFAIKGMWREHRTVCLPDYQGVGIGNALSAFVGSVVAGMRFRFVSTTSHPGMIKSRRNSQEWKITKKPSFSSGGSKVMTEKRYKSATTRFVASFEYVGPSLDKELAFALWNQ